MHARSNSLNTSQDEQYADDPVMEGYLQLLAADKSKVSSRQQQEQSDQQDTTSAWSVTRQNWCTSDTNWNNEHCFLSIACMRHQCPAAHSCQCSQIQDTWFHTIFWFKELIAATLRAWGAHVHLHAQNATKKKQGTKQIETPYKKM